MGIEEQCLDSDLVRGLEVGQQYRRLFREDH